MDKPGSPQNKLFFFLLFFFKKAFWLNVIELKIAYQKIHLHQMKTICNFPFYFVRGAAGIQT